MTDEELRDLVAETSRVAAENSRAIREMREESERRRKEEREESERRREKSEHQWEEYRRQWQESREVSERQWQEILASRRETDRIQQILEDLRRFPQAFPEHRGKKLFGILAAVTIPDDMRLRALKQGLYLATANDDVFELSTPDDFVPRAFGAPDA